MKESAKSGFFERGTEFFRNLHLAIGAVAIAATPFVGPSYEVFAETVAIFEFAHAAILEGLHRTIKHRSASHNAATA